MSERSGSPKDPKKTPAPSPADALSDDALDAVRGGSGLVASLTASASRLPGLGQPKIGFTTPQAS